MRLSSERGQGTASLDPINFSYSADSAGPLTAELDVSSFEYFGCPFHQESRISNQGNCWRICSATYHHSILTYRRAKLATHHAGYPHLHLPLLLHHHHASHLLLCK